jgi:hypothetical protein
LTQEYIIRAWFRNNISEALVFQDRPLPSEKRKLLEKKDSLVLLHQRVSMKKILIQKADPSRRRGDLELNSRACLVESTSTLKKTILEHFTEK